MHTVIEV